VAILQHSLPFLQSESFQTHVGTIHRRAIGPLAHHNGISSYSPSLACHLPAPTIECLHRPRYKLTCSSRNFPIRTSSSNQKESIARHTSTSVLGTISKPHSSRAISKHVFTRAIPTHPPLQINPTPKTTNLVTIETPVHCCVRNHAVLIGPPSQLLRLLRKRNNVLLSHCCSSANVIEPREPHTCNNIMMSLI
jgi:hypothetical protein